MLYIFVTINNQSSIRSDTGVHSISSFSFASNNSTSGNEGATATLISRYSTVNSEYKEDISKKATATYN
jgi:hypothetical protein